MNAVTAFSHREEELLVQLEQIQDMDAAITACTMALEQTACELAQDEQDDLARQRQQAVMALARRVPQVLRASGARGELILSGEATPKGKKEKLLQGAKLLGAFLLAALAVYELIEGKTLFAVLQAVGAALLALREKHSVIEGVTARGVACMDAKRAVSALREICRAADLCVNDLELLSREEGTGKLSGTVDDAVLDLLVSQLEAKASGRAEMAMRSLAKAEQLLHMLGMEIVVYDAAHAALFDVLPTMGEARTIRPAIMQDGQIIRRGVAALPAERSVGA